MGSIGTSYNVFGTTACFSLEIHPELSLMLCPYNGPGRHYLFMFTHKHSPFSMWDLIAVWVPRIKLAGISLLPGRGGFAESSYNSHDLHQWAKFILRMLIHEFSIVKSLISAL